MDMDEDLPPELIEQLAAADRAAAGDASGAGGIRICPHCTFENPPGGGTDCEVCGLPLD
jgi:nuclear protein localization family protein 4